MMDGVDDTEAWVRTALQVARVARLGTVDDAGAVRLVPVCFAPVCFVPVCLAPGRTAPVIAASVISASGSNVPRRRGICPRGRSLTTSLAIS